MSEIQSASHDEPVVYEAPTLTVLGSAGELTAGPNGGPEADGSWPHHSSGA